MKKDRSTHNRNRADRPVFFGFTKRVFGKNQADRKNSKISWILASRTLFLLHFTCIHLFIHCDIASIFYRYKLVAIKEKTLIVKKLIENNIYSNVQLNSSLRCKYSDVASNPSNGATLLRSLF